MKDIYYYLFLTLLLTVIVLYTVFMFVEYVWRPIHL